MSSFVGRDLRLVLQSESDIVQPFEQAVAGEVVDLEAGGEAVSSWTLHCSRSRRAGSWVARWRGGQFPRLLFAQDDRKHAVLYAVVGKDVGKRRRDHGAEAKIFQGPDRVFARRSAAEILPGHQDAGSVVARMVQSERCRSCAPSLPRRQS